jgi:predicted dehydrogenase
MEKIRIGIIGCGGIARRSHMPALKAQPGVEIVAVCDVDEHCVKAMAEENDIVNVFTDYKDLLAMDEVDAIDICTPNFVHMQPTIDALNAGKHVIVEKPIARNPTEGQAMVDAAKKSGKKFMVAQCCRWLPESIALKKFIDGGAMGEMYFSRIQAIRRRGIPGWGVFIDKEKQGGGPLIDIGVHILDTTLWLLGHPKPVAASGITYTKFGNRPGICAPWGAWDHTKFTVEDFAAGFVRFENGSTLTIESSFAANIEKDTMSLAILGTEGGCQTNPLKLFREEFGTLVDVSPTNLPKSDMYQAEMRGFIDAIKNDTEVPVTGEQALLVMKILDGIYRSSEAGREVAID